MKKFIGERLVSIIEPWEGDEMVLEFESGSVHIFAVDNSECGDGNTSIYWEEA